jgi:hypothetical protein
VVPPWVARAVLSGSFVAKESLKLSFYLHPHPSSQLRALPPDSHKLTASKVLRAHRVAAYAGEKINETRRLELLCNGKRVDPNMSLQAIRVFLWKGGAEEMSLLYRLAPVQ